MSRKLRVLQLFNRYRYHGGEEQIISNMTPLLNEIADVTNCFFESNDWIGPGAPPRWKQAAWSIYNPASAKHVLDTHRRVKADVWLAHNLLPVGSPSIYHAANRENIPIVQHVQNYRPFSITGTYWIGNSLIGPELKPALFREAVAGAWNKSVLQGLVMASSMRLLLSSGWLSAVRTWIGVSSSTCSHLVEAGIPASRVSLIPPVWRRVRTSSDPPGNYDGGYLFLGRLIPEKGITTLLAAWEELRERRKGCIPVLTICGSGALEGAVREAATRNTSIRYLGSVDGAEKEHLLSNCTAVVVPSLWWDPNPTVVGEAYEYSKPVLAAASGGLTDSVIDGGTGFLHSPGQHLALVEHVCRLETHGNLARTMGAAGSRHLDTLIAPELWKRSMTAALASACSH